MGYYTKFELHAVDVETKCPVSNLMEADITYDLEQIAFGPIERGEYERRGLVNFERWTEEPMKWYDHEADMIALSKEYPTLVFILEGVGEEFPDAWRKWFHNGKFEESYAEITYPRPVNPLFAEFNF
jgi:hypothetical protein